MKILVVAATQFEIETTLRKFGCNELTEGSVFVHAGPPHEIIFLITGVGMVNTTYYLTKELQRTGKKPDLCINAGIAGSFDREINIGEVVEVKYDRFAELGAEDGDNFLTLDEMNLGTQQVPVHTLSGTNEKLEKEIGIALNKLKIKKVSGITVNKVHGEEGSIKKVMEKFDPQIETMESAAFILTCGREQVRAVQLRAISNYVERRNRESWNIPLAIKNLNEFLLNLLPAPKSEIPNPNSQFPNPKS